MTNSDKTINKYLWHQDVWALFIFYILASKYSSIKLGPVRKLVMKTKTFFSNEVGLNEWTDSLKFGGFTWIMAVLVWLVFVRYFSAWYILTSLRLRTFHPWKRRGVRNTRSLIVTSPSVSSQKEKGACSHFFLWFFVCSTDQKHVVNYTSPWAG